MLPKENVKIEKKEAKNGVMVNRGLSEHLLLQNLTSFCAKGSCSCNSGNLQQQSCQASCFMFYL